MAYKKFVASEQEFNTDLFGIKAKIDGVLLVEDENGHQKMSAFEIKTGKNKNQQEYIGQVFFYSLLM